MLLSTHTETPDTLVSPWHRHFLHSLNWSAILGGTVAAIGVHLLLTALGVGAGLGTFTPVSDANPVSNFTVGSAITWTICALVALWFGGFIAGRFSHTLHSGFAHGVLVWSLTLIITLLLLALGAGMVMGGAVKVLGDGMGMASKTTTVEANDPTAAGVKRNADQLSGFVDEGVAYLPANTPQGTLIRARREIGLAATKLFTAGNDVSSTENRSGAIKSLVENAGLTEADATKTVDSWIKSYKELQAQLADIKARADAKARQVADQAASDLSRAAIWTFFGLLAGLFVASHAGTIGAKRATVREDSPLLAAR